MIAQADAKLSGDEPAQTSVVQWTGHKDVRELVETVIFVLVLVNLLRMFGAEAFVIPTGSMATTLLGAHKIAECPQCHVRSRVNASDQVEHGSQVLTGMCQNCRQPLAINGIKPSGGDRVLVGKFLYEGIDDPKRWDVVVFKCPERLKASVNFIKRLIGLPGETIRIQYGDIHVREPGAGDFHIARKTMPALFAIRRLVYDNDHQPGDLNTDERYQRWKPAGWAPAADHRSFTSDKSNSNAWLTYTHLLNGGQRYRGDLGFVPQIITDFEAYNSGMGGERQQANWVGDLMLEADLAVKTQTGAVTFELREGERQYRCVFDLGADTASLWMNQTKLAEIAATVPAGSSFAVAGAHFDLDADTSLRFSNFDDQLTVWVDEKVVLQAELPPMSPEEFGPTDDDLQAARIGAQQADVVVSGLRLYRDAYYTQTAQHSDVFVRYPIENPAIDPLNAWRRSLQSKMRRPYEIEIGPEEHFMLGDNSPSSSDGREWNGVNTVHRRLILGRALVLYWPPWNWRVVR